MYDSELHSNKHVRQLGATGIETKMAFSFKYVFIKVEDLYRVLVFKQLNRSWLT